MTAYNFLQKIQTNIGQGFSRHRELQANQTIDAYTTFTVSTLPLQMQQVTRLA